MLTVNWLRYLSDNFLNSGLITSYSTVSPYILPLFIIEYRILLCVLLNKLWVVLISFNVMFITLFINLGKLPVYVTFGENVLTLNPNKFANPSVILFAHLRLTIPFARFRVRVKDESIFCTAVCSNETL
jgi:hypothetical protein